MPDLLFPAINFFFTLC